MDQQLKSELISLCATRGRQFAAVAPGQDWKATTNFQFGVTIEQLEHQTASLAKNIAAESIALSCAADDVVGCQWTLTCQPAQQDATIMIKCERFELPPNPAPPGGLSVAKVPLV